MLVSLLAEGSLPLRGVVSSFEGVSSGEGVSSCEGVDGLLPISGEGVLSPRGEGVFSCGCQGVFVLVAVGRVSACGGGLCGAVRGSVVRLVGWPRRAGVGDPSGGLE